MYRSKTSNYLVISSFFTISLLFHDLPECCRAATSDASIPRAR